MLFNSITESVMDQQYILEGVEDRFPYDSILEAGAITLGENEKNWTTFMKACGLTEYTCIKEGIEPEMIYESGRLKSFIDKAIAWFKTAIDKLKEVTVSAINKISSLILTNNAFLKKYESKLRSMSLPAKFEYEGYEFYTLDTPKYGVANFKVDANTDASKYTADAAAKKIAELNGFGKDVKGASSFGADVRKGFSGEKKKLSVNLKEEVEIIKSTKGLKESATKSFKEAHKLINNIITELKKQQKEVNKDLGDKEKGATAGVTSKNLTDIIAYWRKYSQFCHTFHINYMWASVQCNYQAKAICSKALNMSLRSEGKTRRNKIRTDNGLKAHDEGYVETDAFLGAVEFI